MYPVDSLPFTDNDGEMNTDRNGLAKEYDLANVRSDIAAVNSVLAVHSSQFEDLKAGLKAVNSKFDVLQDEVTVLKIDVAVIRSNYVTNADLANLEARMASLEVSLLKWFIATWLAMAGSMLTAVGTTFVIVKFVH